MDFDWFGMTLGEGRDMDVVVGWGCHFGCTLGGNCLHCFGLARCRFVCSGLLWNSSLIAACGWRTWLDQGSFQRVLSRSKLFGHHKMARTSRTAKQFGCTIQSQFDMVHEVLVFYLQIWIAQRGLMTIWLNIVGFDDSWAIQFAQFFGLGRWCAMLWRWVAKTRPWATHRLEWINLHRLVYSRIQCWVLLSSRKIGLAVSPNRYFLRSYAGVFVPSGWTPQLILIPLNCKAEEHSVVRLCSFAILFCATASMCIIAVNSFWKLAPRHRSFSAFGRPSLGRSTWFRVHVYLCRNECCWKMQRSVLLCVIHGRWRWVCLKIGIGVAKNANKLEGTKDFKHPLCGHIMESIFLFFAIWVAIPRWYLHESWVVSGYVQPPPLGLETQAKTCTPAGFTHLVNFWQRCEFRSCFSLHAAHIKANKFFRTLEACLRGQNKASRVLSCFITNFQLGLC